MILDILLLLWVTCAGFNLLISTPLLLDGTYEEKVKELQKAGDDREFMSKLEIVAMSILLAPIITFLIVTSNGDSQ